ncbi:conserved hypothetical protein [Culex quinquefasciatus]|uniref:Uncharacterized protein n=1 Tax=Culex quinquefasciatus TaxID=7176 RepID=B0W0F2_CULQU|nr:conserved hypothetical protein [Culex quinquefasciatus]|eukprot:XP_001842186.1 conserved hypothetical protein [Culex quinquefasciatus]
MGRSILSGQYGSVFFPQATFGEDPVRLADQERGSYEKFVRMSAPARVLASTLTWSNAFNHLGQQWSVNIYEVNLFNDGLDELLSKAKATGTAGAADSTTPKPAVTLSTSEAVATITTATATSTTGPGKIFVVPTNLLLKPPTSTVNLNSPIPIYTQPTSSIASSMAPSGAGMAPMKLLLVNTPKPAVTLSTSEAVATITTATATSTTGPGKIFVVPTNLLLKPPTSTVNLNSPIPIYTQPTHGSIRRWNGPDEAAAGEHHLQGRNHLTDSDPGLGSHGTVPDATSPDAGTLTHAHSDRTQATNRKHSRAQQSLETTHDDADHHGNIRRRKTKTASLPQRREIFRLQNPAQPRENLAVSRARLALDKERLEFEKQIGGPLVDVVRNLSGFFNGFLQQFQHQQQQLQQKQTVAGSRPARNCTCDKTRWLKSSLVLRRPGW